MSSHQLTSSVLRRVKAVSRLRNQFILKIGSGYTTTTQNGYNYYDIFDKRNLTESPGFEKNDPRRSWTNRDESTSEDYMDVPDEFNTPQRSVSVFRRSTISNQVSKVQVPINLMEGDDVVSGITYNILGIEGNRDLEELYYQLENINSDRFIKSLQTSKEKMELLEGLQVQFERLLHHRKLKMDQIVKVLLVLDRIDSLPHELRNLIQSSMLLNIHKFTPFQIITTFEIYNKERERYQKFLNVLCLIFYDQMIPYIRKRPGYEKEVELKHVLKFIKVLKDFKFKRLTDVLYAQVYDNLDKLKVEEMVEVSNAFFKNKKDKNFVEMYSRILSVVFKMPLLDLYNFENYAERRISENEKENQNENENDNQVEIVDNRNIEGSEDVEWEDINVLRSIFNCSSEFLMSSVHHRIEFKRLWRNNIKNNNVSWKVSKYEGEPEVDKKEEDKKMEIDDSPEIKKLEKKLETSVRVNSSVSYLENFGELYGKIEKTILKHFKFGNHEEEFLSNLIQTVLDYSRYSHSPNTGNILSNLYALLLNTPKEKGEEVKNLEKISPKTIMDNSHVYFYKIDDNCEFFKSDRINYYKPNLPTHLLLKGDFRLYSLLMEVFRSYISGMDGRNCKEEGLRVCRLIRSVVHPFYCLKRRKNKKFLTLDLIHMRGNLKDKSKGQFEDLNENLKEVIEKLLKGGLKGEIEKFTEKAKEYISGMFENDLRLGERLEVLRTLLALKICNGDLEEGEEVKEYVKSTVDKMLEYLRMRDKEDLEDGIKVGVDLKLFDLITDLLEFHPSSEKIYELLQETLKTVYARLKYYSVPELVKLSSCILSSDSHLAKMDLESEEILENLNQTIRIMKEETVGLFELKSGGEDYFNEETRKIYNFVMRCHSF